MLQFLRLPSRHPQLNEERSEGRLHGRRRARLVLQPQIADESTRCTSARLQAVSRDPDAAGGIHLLRAKSVFPASFLHFSRHQSQATPRRHRRRRRLRQQRWPAGAEVGRMQPPLQSPMSEQHGHGEAGALGRGGGAGARGSAAVLYPSRDDSAAAQATPISGNRWYGAAAAPMPFCRIHGTGAPEADGSHGLGAATDSWTDADDLSPIHARRGFTGGSGTSSISPTFRRQPILDPAW